MRLFCTGLFLVIFFMQAASAQEPSEQTYIHAGRLLADPASGVVETEKTLVIENGSVVEIRDGYVNAEDAIDLKDDFVLPGLIDSHVHLLHENGPADKLERVTKTSSDLALDGVLFARRTLEAGFTTVANVSDDYEAIFALRDAIAAGKTPGPRVLASGGALSPHGGAGDVHGYRPDVAELLRYPKLCSGADDCRRVVREMVSRGADLIKVMGTGSVLSDDDAGLGQQFTDGEIEAIVETAHRLGRLVTAHAHGADGLNAFLRAGGDSIEHGTYLDDESIRLFKKNGAYLVPTLMAGEAVTKWGNDPESWLSPSVREKAKRVGPQMIEATRRAHQAGVKISFGTDASVSPHGRNAHEFSLLVEAGLTPLEAIQSATVNAADHLRLADEAGAVKPGMPADIIAIDENPLDNIAALERVTFVMKGGVVFKRRM